jgi:hypothetical protein
MLILHARRICSNVLPTFDADGTFSDQNVGLEIRSCPVSQKAEEFLCVRN